ncbi:hypothetical protein [Acinetobacter radioresistens]|uniref:hypothetical protein n=1 Tax=Acinetobacter radioresistens TaxID=40216 RepID=UPI0020034593|nr:hypothetical protein [Acinetobacter radioresistens]MCK4081803.1 hypothetical protein [Acinetobacter radioresistens]MCU4607612.1 hypothetical protein [Acinetobacter radioresistens]HAV5332159.1 hypothetical protein [Acinetobacter baumannii]
MTDNLEQQQPIEQDTALSTINNSSIETAIPDKFKVTAEDGSVDYKATVAKMNESYSYLEKKVGTGEVAPKSADEYKIEREDFNFDDFKADESNKAFLEEAHKHGITNKQLDFLLNEYDKRAVDLVSNNSQFDTDSTVQTLQSEWGKEYESNIFSAIRAAKSAGLTEDQINDPSIGNNVAVIKALAYFGSQIAEDKPINNGTPVNVDIQSLMRSEAFFDPKHPNHKSVKAQIDSYYDSLRR